MSEKLRSSLVVILIAVLIAVAVAISAPKAGKQPETFTGVWRDAFETADFHAGFSAENFPDFNEPPDGWLSFETGVWPSDIRSPDDPDWEQPALYEITFVGRRVVGPAGHLGAYPAEYFAERIISIEQINQSDAVPEAAKSSSIQP